MPYQAPILGELSKLTLCSLKQPMTAKQLSRLNGLSVDSCSSLFEKLVNLGLVKCINQGQRRSRLYFVTSKGMLEQAKLRASYGLPPMVFNFPRDKDFWENYGWSCFSHRSIILITMKDYFDKHKESINPAQIKRRAKFIFPFLRMSANNARDAIKAMVKRKIVKRDWISKGRGNPYKLTEMGDKFAELHIESGKMELLLYDLWQKTLKQLRMKTESRDSA